MIKHLATATAFLLVGAGLAGAANPTGTDWQVLEQRVRGIEGQMRRAPVPPLPVPSAPVLADTSQKRFVVAQSAASLAVRVDRLENQMRVYNGQIEELNFRLRQMQEQLRRFQEDSEFRFQDLERGGKKKRSKQSRAPKSQKSTQNQTFQQLGSPPQSLGSLNGAGAGLGTGAALGQAANQALNGSGNSGPIDLSRALQGGAAVPGATFQGSNPVGNAPANNVSASLTGDPVTDYDQAYGLVLQGAYGPAEGAFRQFVQAYGSHRLMANAHYWLGESQFQQRNYRGAIETFLSAYSAYPKAQKAPDMLLKTGMSLRQIKEREAACATYEELLAKYPNASAGVRQKVRAEIKSAKC
ncbi:MAG: tol-pal system protein YbgF [Cohaesibacter sp.]|nr:tol-pal system protein YbgF [Cohaesibacter sp.]